MERQSLSQTLSDLQKHSSPLSTKYLQPCSPSSSRAKVSAPTSTEPLLPFSSITLHSESPSMSTMDDYVRRQRAIPVNELSQDDTECICCSTVYGQLQAEGSIEHAVKLECLHIIGSICLTKWLQCSKSCPHVSHSLIYIPSLCLNEYADRDFI